MNCKQDIILILDSILDDYYLLWECFEEYKQNMTTEINSKIKFSLALKEGYERKFFDFFIGEHFDGDEELIHEFVLTDAVIEELLDYRRNFEREIRVTTSRLGIEFLEKCRSTQ